MNRIYMDYNASAPLAEGLSEQMKSWMDEDFKNPASVHQDGQKAKALMVESRKTLLNALGASQNYKLAYCSGGTEGNNAVLNSAYRNRGDRNKLLITNVEHSCVHNYALMLEKQGVELVWITVDRYGQIDLDDYQSKLTDDVFLATVMLAQNETGFVFPIKQMVQMAREKNIPFHTDIVCAAAKMNLSLDDMNPDFATFSSHKFGGIKGHGGVIFHKQTRFTPFVLGGPQENEKRAGTENVYGALCSAYALQKSCEDLDQKIQSMKSIRAILKEGIQKIYPEAVFNESETNLPQTLNVSFPGLNGTLILTNLDLEGVSCSYGSACASGSLEISRVMASLKLKFDESRSALRFSYGPTIDETKAQDFLGRLERVIHNITS